MVADIYKIDWQGRDSLPISVLAKRQAIAIAKSLNINEDIFVYKQVETPNGFVDKCLYKVDKNKNIIKQHNPLVP